MSQVLLGTVFVKQSIVPSSTPSQSLSRRRPSEESVGKINRRVVFIISIILPLSLRLSVFLYQFYVLSDLSRAEKLQVRWINGPPRRSQTLIRWLQPSVNSDITYTRVCNQTDKAILFYGFRSFLIRMILWTSRTSSAKDRELQTDLGKGGWVT